MTAIIGQGQQTNSGTATSSAPDLATILARMEQAQEENHQHFRAYVMTRDYRLYGSNEAQPTSEVVAAVNFVPPSEKTFTIESVQGSERGKTIVQNLLSTEAAVSRENSPAAVNRQNYDFSLAGDVVIEGSPCWVLQVRPKREEKDLLKGTAWLDKQTYLLRRVDGDMAKNPSWWIKQVHVTVTFANVDGMWLQTGTRAVADVRLVGRHTLVGQATKVQTSEQVAQLPPKTPRTANRSRAASTVLGVGVLVEHFQH